MTENNIENALEESGIFVSTTSGVSMFPMLRNRRDTIVVMPTDGRLEKYDVALYKRGGSYVLHRVIKVLPDSYIIRGDNCMLKEHVKDSDVLGKLVKFYRKDKEKDMESFGYRAYSRLIVLINPLVCIKLRIKWVLHKSLPQ